MKDGLIFGPLPTSTIHLCVDMQLLFAAGRPWHTPWIDRVLPQILNLIGSHPGSTIFTRFITPRLPSEMPGRWQHFYQRWIDVTRKRMNLEDLELLPALKSLAPPGV